MRAALALIALALAAAAGAAADLPPAPEAATPILGPFPLRSGSWYGGVRDPDAAANAAAPAGPPIRVRVEVAFPDGTVESGTVAAPAGHWTSFGPTRSRRFLSDVDVEIACSNSAEGAPSCVPDPMVKTAFEGIAADLRTFRTAGGGVGLEAIVQAGRFDEGTPFVPLEAAMEGRIQLPRWRGAVAVVAGRLDADTGLSARLEGRDGPVGIRFVPTSIPPVRPGAAAGAAASAADAPLPPPGGEEETSGTFGDWLDLEARELPWWSASPPPPPDVRALVVDLRLLAAGDEIARYSLPALAGRTVVARAGTDETIVYDWDVEVGCYNAIGDPLVRSVFSGDAVRLLPRLSPRGRVVLLDLAFVHRETQIAPPETTGAKVVGILHSVRADRAGVDAELALVPGEPFRLAAGTTADGRPLTLEVTVRR